MANRRATKKQACQQARYFNSSINHESTSVSSLHCRCCQNLSRDVSGDDVCGASCRVPSHLSCLYDIPIWIDFSSDADHRRCAFFSAFYCGSAIVNHHHRMLIYNELPHQIPFRPQYLSKSAIDWFDRQNDHVYSMTQNDLCQSVCPDNSSGDPTHHHSVSVDICGELFAGHIVRGLSFVRVDCIHIW